MKTADNTTAPAASPSCPPWCVTRHNHDPQDRNYRTHRSAPLTTPDLYVVVSEDEPLNARAWYLAKGPCVYVEADNADGIRLTARQAAWLAEVLSTLGQQDAGRLLREAVALATGGAS